MIIQKKKERLVQDGKYDIWFRWQLYIQNELYDDEEQNPDLF